MPPTCRLRVYFATVHLFDRAAAALPDMVAAHPAMCMAACLFLAALARGDASHEYYTMAICHGIARVPDHSLQGAYAATTRIATELQFSVWGGDPDTEDIMRRLTSKAHALAVLLRSLEPDFPTARALPLDPGPYAAPPAAIPLIRPLYTSDDGTWAHTDLYRGFIEACDFGA
jgi:hypothetical protein